MKELKSAILMLIIFTVICGGIYPALVTGIAQAVYPEKANGSLIVDRNGKIAGSKLVGQPFSDPKYFWPRPSATTDFGYNPYASGGSNAGPTNPDYIKTVSARVMGLRENGITGTVPSELVQASASGIDPHLSPDTALLQVRRVSKARGIPERTVAEVVSQVTEERQLSVFGTPRVNILVLNLALDRLKP